MSLRDAVMRQHRCNVYCNDPEHCEVVHLDAASVVGRDLETFFMEHYRQYDCPTTRWKPAADAPAVDTVGPDPDPLAVAQPEGENQRLFLVWFNVEAGESG